MPAPSRRLRLVCGSAALVVLSAACSSGGHRETRSTTVPASTTIPPPTSTTEPAPVYAPSPFVWTRESSTALDLGGGPTATLSALLPPQLSQPWALVGTRLSAAGTPAATMWTSPDGIVWAAAPLDPSGPSQADAVADYHGNVVVAGAVGEGANEQAAVWSSPQPGSPFTADPVPMSDGPSVMTLVTEGPLGLFAVGTVDGRFAMWSSTTGKRWGELPTAEKTISSTPGARVNALMAEGDVVYAAGSVPGASGTEAAVWSSGDGFHWRLVTTAALAFAGPGSRVILSLAPLGTGLVAVGAVNRGIGWQPASWISPDGNSWSQPSSDFPEVAALPAGSAALSVSAVTTFAGATSVVASTGGPAGERAWTSSDGMHWSPLAVPARAAASNGWRPTAIAATTTTTVIVDGDPGQPHVLTAAPSGWAEPSSNPAVFGSVQPYASPVRLVGGATGLTLEVAVTADPQAVGATATTTVVLTSRDGVDWQPAPASDHPAQPATSPEPGALTGRLAGGGWVAVGPSTAGYPESWTSPGGVAWTPTGPLDPISPTTGTRPPAEVTALCTTSSGTATTPGGGVAAVGASIVPATAATELGRSATGWWSVAGSSWHRATVTPGPQPGTDESMLGCSDTGAGLVAFGTSPGSGGAPAPALWRSATGAAWTRQAVAAFAVGSPAPITALATDGPDWVAVADPARTGPGPVGVLPTTENGMNGAWLSGDAGQTWERVDLVSAPWPGALQTEVALAGFAGGVPVLAGTVDGQLAVWSGSPVAPGSPTATGG